MGVLRAYQISICLVFCGNPEPYRLRRARGETGGRGRWAIRVGGPRPQPHARPEPDRPGQGRRTRGAGCIRDSNKTLIGNDPDIGYAVAGLLGLEPVIENTSWENLFVGLDSAKYNVGISNITVTEERKEKYDFATYRLDNLAFVTKKGAGLKVTGPADVAGKTVAVSSGTNQEKILVEWSKEDEAKGLKPVNIKYYQTNQATYLALGAGQIEAYLGPNPSVAYQVAIDPKFEIVGTYSGAGATLQGKIALTTKKDNGLVKALGGAVDKLIATGDYQKILQRWNLTNEAVTSSEINPPGLPKEGK